MNIACATPDLETWHRHLGHVNYDSIIHMAEKKLATGMLTSLAYLPQICEHCVLAKQTQTPVPRLQEGGRAKRLLGKVFSDITGPETVKTSHGKLYTLNLIDDYSQKCWVYALKQKREAFDHFKDWKELVKRETGKKVQIFHMDNGGEYSSSPLDPIQQGTSHNVRKQISREIVGKMCTHCYLFKGSHTNKDTERQPHMRHTIGHDQTYHTFKNWGAKHLYSNSQNPS